MRSKQYFTSIKNNPHEISTDPALALLECALRRVDADKLRRSSNLMLKVILP